MKKVEVEVNDMLAEKLITYMRAVDNGLYTDADNIWNDIKSDSNMLVIEIAVKLSMQKKRIENVKTPQGV